MYYHNTLHSLSAIETILELSKSCKQLEEAANIRSPSHKTLLNFLESELAYQDDTSVQPASSSKGKHWPKRSDVQPSQNINKNV